MEGDRAELVEAAMILPGGYLEVPEASAAVAAAAPVAAANGMRIDMAGPAIELLRTGGILADIGVPGLVRVALARVTGTDCKWRELWEEAGQLSKAVTILGRIQAHL